MKLSCLRKNLNSGLQTVERAIAKNSTLPILDNILLETDRGRLKCSATNLELAVIARVGSKIVKPGRITVPSRIISSLVGSLPNKKIDLEVKGNSLFVSSEGGKSKIKGLPAKDFPLIPTIKEKATMSIGAPVLKRALSQVVSSASVSESRPELSGVFWKVNGQDLRLVATDSYRLAEKKIFLREKQKEFSFILPLKTSNELVRLLTEREGEVSLSVDDNQAKFSFFGVEIISRLLDGSFPDYERIIPGSFKTEAVLNVSSFASNVKLASLFSGRVDEISLKFAKSSRSKFLEVKAASGEIGSQESKLAVNIKKGGSGNISLNHRYLLEGLSNILTDEVMFLMNDGGTPVMFRPYSEARRPKDKDFLYLIMPIRR